MTPEPASRSLTMDQERMLARFDVLDRELGTMAGELERLREMAAMGELAAMIAHEVRNIMTPVSGACQKALRDGADHQTALVAAQAGLDATERIRAVTDAVLDLAHLAGQGRISDSADLPRCLERVLGWYRERLEEAGVRTIVEIDTSMACAIAPVALEQVLSNMIENALRSVPEGGELRFRTEPGRSTGNIPGGQSCVRLIVEDSGPGVREEMAAWLRDVFAANDDTVPPPPSPDGRGFGLRLCTRLVSQARGLIELDTDFDRGARFIITLAAAGVIEQGSQAA